MPAPFWLEEAVVGHSLQESGSRGASKEQCVHSSESGLSLCLSQIVGNKSIQKRVIMEGKGRESQTLQQPQDWI